MGIRLRYATRYFILARSGTSAWVVVEDLIRQKREGGSRSMNRRESSRMYHGDFPRGAYVHNGCRIGTVCRASTTSIPDKARLGTSKWGSCGSPMIEIKQRETVRFRVKNTFSPCAQLAVSQIYSDRQKNTMRAVADNLKIRANEGLQSAMSSTPDAREARFSSSSRSLSRISYRVSETFDSRLKRTNEWFKN